MVEPNSLFNTHHIWLDDGVSSMGLVAVDQEGDSSLRSFSRDPVPGSGIQMFQGTMEYTDEAPPFFPKMFDDWSQGRGVLTASLKAGGYADSHAMYTMREGQMHPAGMPVYTQGAYNWEGYWQPFNSDTYFLTYDEWKLVDQYNGASVDQEHIAIKLTGNSTKREYVHAIVRHYGNPANDVNARLWTDSGGSPNTISDTASLSSDDLLEGVWYEHVFEFSTGATPSGDYWVGIDSNLGTTTAWWEVLVSYPTVGNTVKYANSPVAGWSSVSESEAPLIRCMGERDDYKAHFFQYRHGWYMAKEMNDGGQASLWINGDRGVANGSQSTTTLQDDTKTWVANQWKGAIVKLAYGTGSNQVQTWRVIDSNTTDTLTISGAWGETPADTVTEYVIMGSRYWTEISTTATPPDWDVGPRIITNVRVINNIVYFCHGDDDAMTSMKEENVSGTYTRHFVAEDGQYSHIVGATDQEGSYILGATGGIPSKYAIATPQDGSGSGAHTKLTFDSELTAWDIGERCQNLIRYGEWGEVWAIKEGSTWRMLNRKWYKTSPAEMENTIDDRNGEAVMVTGVYLYYSWHDSAVRYFRNNLDGVNPNKDEYPLPANRKGYVGSMAGYPGMKFFGYDAGNDNYSHILALNEFGFHEIFRAPTTGMRIHSIAVQSIPGDNHDFLWVQCGSDILYVPIALDPYLREDEAPRTYTYFPFKWSSELDTPYMYWSRRNILKMFKNIELSVENSQSNDEIAVFYRIDNSTSWTRLGEIPSNTYGTAQDTGGQSNRTGFNLSDAYDKTGYRIQFKFVIQPAAASVAPRIVAAVVTAFIKNKKNWVSSLTVLVQDQARTKQGHVDTKFETVAKKQAQFEIWDAAPIALSVESEAGIINNKYIVLDVGASRVVETYDDGSYLWQMMFYELA